MSRIDVLMPQMGESIAEGTLSKGANRQSLTAGQLISLAVGGAGFASGLYAGSPATMAAGAATAGIGVGWPYILSTILYTKRGQDILIQGLHAPAGSKRAVRAIS